MFGSWVKKENKLLEAQSSEEVDIIRAEIFGKNGLINSEFKKLASLFPEDKKWASVIRIIEATKDEASLVLNANTLDQRVVCYLLKKELQDLQG